MTGSTIRDDDRANLAAALDRAEHRGLRALREHPDLARGLREADGRERDPPRGGLPPMEHLVNLNLTRKRLVAILDHQLVSDQVRHPPRRLL